MQLNIGYLYSDLMNIYGDSGNIITLLKRAQWRGIDIEVKNISTGDNLKPKECDLYFFGGGQDLAQVSIAKDLTTKSKGEVLKTEVERGVPLLAICGGYQLLGDYYQPHQGHKLEGISLFPAYTIAGDKRMIGDIVVQLNRTLVDQLTGQSSTRSTGLLAVGFENHSGKTYLKPGASPLGRVVQGFGNNGEDATEGCVHKNAVGCYMHGSLLPKNPDLADWFLKKALEVKYEKNIELKQLDDELENLAHNCIVKRFG